MGFVFVHAVGNPPSTSDLEKVERYRAAIEPKRKCIVDRESEGHYDVVNPSGAYRGAYQVSASLARGATWMMLKEHKPLVLVPRETPMSLPQLRNMVLCAEAGAVVLPAMSCRYISSVHS